MALITGKCSDVGRPDDGSAVAGSGRACAFLPRWVRADASGCRHVYNKRFTIGLADEDARDLVHFLEAL